MHSSSTNIINLPPAIAVGPDVFRQDSKSLIEMLMRIQRMGLLSVQPLAIQLM